MSETTTPPDPFTMVSAIKSRGPAPVHLWDPPYCGEINMEIKRDGTWFHEGRPIRRQAMVRLFASVLKKEDDKIYLVTPVEKVGIKVEDCPFVIVDMDVEEKELGRAQEGKAKGETKVESKVESKGNVEELEQVISFETNTGERFTLDDEHGLTISPDPETEEPHPVVHVRSGLDGLINRAVFYRLVELASEHKADGETRLGVWSSGIFFPFYTHNTHNSNNSSAKE